MKQVLALAVGMSILAIPALAQEEPVLNIYNWSDYIAEDTISNFEAQTGIKVNYDVFDGNEVLEAKMLTGSSGYDVVVPTNNFLERQIQAGIYMELDASKLPNLKNMDPAIMTTLAISDPGNTHAIVYMWGTTGMGYSAKAIAERMPDAPSDSWDMIFDPEIAKNFADCGITMLDAPAEVMSAALNYLGLDPLSEDEGDLQKATDLVLSVRPYIRYFHSSQYISDLANGDICLSLGWSGDIFIAQARAVEAANGVEVVYVIPKEGAQVWTDNMAIPKDAPHPDNAHKFINYIMEPEVVAAISDYVFYANGNAASTPLIDPAVTGDPAIYPPDDVKAKLFAIKSHSPAYDRLLTRAWTRIKTGQ
ncbi:MAG: polyamine ABC transporter substrate-binding protein [Alphaproteobacteria bacterium]|nr:polyamine ABC transporter substrate-binding protein [Alphaproteobacteria bacterium]